MSDPEEVVVSAETLERMENELLELTTTGRDQMSERIQRAREFGDIRENAEYDAAKDAQGLMEARIRRLEHMIKNAVVRETPAEADVAKPGLVVTIKEEGEEETDDYLFASSPEDRMPGVRTITTASPVGSAIVGKAIGETVEVKAPAGTFRVTIVALRPV
ncbi:MAG: transcription elongation factor GreA [Actinomycetota bacterium]